MRCIPHVAQRLVQVGGLTIWAISIPSLSGTCRVPLKGPEFFVKAVFFASATDEEWYAGVCKGARVNASTAGTARVSSSRSQDQVPNVSSELCTIIGGQIRK
jgi:hypothetical protein